MHATDRLADERTFYDRQARDRAAHYPDPGVLGFDDGDFLDHETWVRPAFARLGELAGLTALDLGCGHGMAAVVMARRGARVIALDVSPGYLAEARTRAAVNGVAVDFVQADAQRLPFADSTFDRVWGNAVLHHLDLAVAAGELRRVLRPGGVAVFCEPWGGNPLVEWARRRLPYPGKHHTRDERPLRGADLAPLRAAFPRLEVEGYQLLGMARRVVGPGRLVRGLDWCDARLLKRVPALGRLCRYAVLTMRREG
jgi:SAM-dependent methyltransferase